jgi:hypothetical protein
VTAGGTLFGNPGLLVSTPGVISGEGVITPASQVQDTVNHSFSVYIQGIVPGSLTVYALANPGGIILGSAPVTLTTDGSWQRVTINNLPANTSQTLSIEVTTSATEATQFWINNVQIEESSTAHAYCDGNQPGCFWQSTVGGISFQPFQNTLTAVSNIINSSDIVLALIQGEAFNVTAIGAKDTNSSDLVSISFSAGPAGAMTDFSVAAITDPDPALTYANWNNAGVTAPTSGYNRSWSTFYPPQNYFVSNGQLLYPRAAFMAVGWQFSNVPNNSKAVISDVQAEILPIITGFTAPAPTNYVLPRQIQTIVKPNRLNFCTNPSFEAGTQNWSAVGTGVLSQDITIAGPNTTQLLDDVQRSSGVASMKVAVTNPGDGASIQVSNLIAGDTYIVSAYVQANTNVTDVLMSCANGSTSASHGNGGTGYGNGGYGSGYYGGNPASASPLPTGQWFRIFTTFQPTDSVATLTLTCTFSLASNFWVDAVLIEAGEVLGNFFDGSFGTNYFWETGGTPALSRSYYYDQFSVKSQAVDNVLVHHTPLGISSATPVFNIPYTQ